MDIAQAYIQIMPTTEGIGDALTTALGPAADAAGEEAGKGAGNKLVGALGGAAKIGAAALGAVAGATTAAGAALVGAAGGVASYGDNIDKMSQKLGISATAYQEWDAVLQHSGTSIDTLKAGMRTLSGELSGASGVIAETAAADAKLEEQLESGAISFEEYNKQYDALYESAYKDLGALGQLGLSMSDIEAMSLDSDLALEKVITALQSMPEGAERTALAQDLLGRSAMEMGALLNTSAEDTQAMRDKVHELGGVMSDDAVKAAAAYQDSLQDMQTSMSGIKNNLVADFLPGMTTVMDGVADLFTGGSGDQIAEGLDGIIGTVAEKIPQVAETGGQIVTAIGEAVANNLPRLTEAGLSVMMMLLSTIMASLPQMADSGLQMIVTLASGIASALPELIPAVTDTVMSIVDGLIDHAPELISAALEIMVALGTGLINALPNVISRLPEIITGIVSALTGAAPQIMTAGVTLLTSLVGNLPQIIASILSAVAQITVSIPRAILESVPQMVSAGVNLIAGLGKGLIDGVAGVIRSAKQVAGDILGAIKGFFGIHSPSTVTTGFGLLIDEGFPVGFRRGLPAVIRSARDMADAITGALQPDPDDLTITPAIEAAQPETAVLRVMRAVEDESVTARTLAAQRAAAPEPRRGDLASQSIASRMVELLDDCINLLARYLPAIADKRMVVDRASLTEGLAPGMDERLGLLAYYRGREATT